MLFEKLSDKEVRLMRNYIDEFGPNNGSRVYEDSATMDHILRFWDKEKSDYLYRLLGEQFIIEKEVSYTIPFGKLRDQVRNSIENGKMKPFYQAFSTEMKNRFGLNIWSDEWNAWTALTSFENITKNSLVGYFYPETASFVINFDNGQKVKIESSTKPIRALGKIAKIIGLEKEYEEFRLEHSRILNQKQLNGTLCLSIHPMDYITMSDNASKWKTCMEWRNDGSYRMGTVEMMNSPCVIVAYLKSDNSTYYNWNDKHWRTLMIATEEIIASVKAYPYAHEELTKTCVDWIKELSAKNLGWSFGPTAEIFDESVFEYGDNNYYYFTAESRAMYNDFDSTKHFGALPIHLPDSSSYEDPYMLTVCYSGKTECMNCGEEVDYNIYDESYVFCDACCSNAEEEEERCACDECGEYWDYDDMYYVEGYQICPDCIDRVAGSSIHDGEYYFCRNLTRIYLARENDNPDTDNDGYCFVHYTVISDNFNSCYDYHSCTNHDVRKTENGTYYFNREDLTDRGMNWWFNMWNEEVVNNYFRSTT